MTIHTEHPFATGGPDRSPLRRLRGRLPSPVSVWTSGQGGLRRGWTVSSVLLADGDPGEVAGLVDEDSDLADRLRLPEPADGPVPVDGPPPVDGPRFVVNLLGWSQRTLADVFAGLAPAPGGAFRLASWTDTAWGPVLDGSVGWVGVRRTATEPEHAGWGLLVRGVIEHVEVADLPDDGVLSSFRGRYRPVREL